MALSMTAIVVAAAVLVFTTVIIYVRTSLSAKKSSPPLKARPPPDTVILHTFGRISSVGAPNPSPFAVKLETFLRLANIKYVNVFGIARGSKGKVPWIEYNGEDICDSYFIIQRLKKDFNIQLDGRLTDEQKATSAALERLVEGSLFWALTYHRYVLHSKVWLATILGDAPALIRGWIGSHLKAQVVDSLHKQGYGRHTREEVDIIALEDLRALSSLLGSKPFFMGDEMCSIDCTCYSVLSLISPRGFCCDGLKQLMDTEPGLDNLNKFVERVSAKVWPDLDQLPRA